MAGLPPFVLEPFNDRCRVTCEEREHVVVGVSPGNSYFRAELFASLLGWLCEEFRQVDVVVPDSALRYTYLALGYSERRAAKKVHTEVSVLRNRVERGWSAGGGRRPRDGVYLMSDLVGRDSYQSLLARAEEAMDGDPTLRLTGLRMTRVVLLSRGQGAEPTSGQLEQGLRYLVAELPFFLSSADIFGVPSSVCVYHQEVPLADVIFAGGSPLCPSAQQAYAVVRAVDAPGRRPERVTA
ncbi:tRNA-dependent cyclodipeptide synthase [Streptomyces sp. B6B3]|uniref:tRNA-dependent cyclodipeptide synthase n=1 Tax=Streptomyces sp. B6B3 TaxID=3153570 RepID=UPI00325F3624